MGITRAQIARQLLSEGGKIGNTTFQLARKRSDGKRPGYYGSDAGFGDDDYKDESAAFDAGSGSGENNTQGVTFADARSAIEARTPKETFAQKLVNQIKKLGKYSPTLNTLKGIGGFFGGAFDKLANLRGFNPDGTRRTQAQYEQARRDRINQNRISNIMGRDAPFTNLTLDRLAKLGYTGPLEGLIGSTNVTRSATSDQNFPDPVEGIVSQAPTTFRDAMANLNLERGVPRDEVFLTEAQKNYIDQNKTISSEDLGTVQQNIKDATGYDSELAKTFGLEELLASGAAKKGVAFGYNLTDKGKALERFRKDATGMNNPSNPNMPYKGLGVQSQLNQLLKNENTNAMKNKNYIQEQINKGFLQNKEDFINQETLGKYL